MPQWAGSSWYFLRYVDNHNNEELVSREKADAMLPVDMYIGGVEHAVLHLLYSRFYTKFLCDIGVIDFDEPFVKLFNQGMITGKNGIKMSKSKGNVVSPDDLVRDYGCDSLRMYELFVGPPELDAEWDDRGIDGVYRFLKKLWNLLMDSKDKDIKPTKEMIKVRHKLVYDITTRLESFSLNTVISAFMEHTNTLVAIAKKEGGVDRDTLDTLAVLLAPFAPHMAEEIWEELGNKESVFRAGWPKYDTEAMKDDEIEIPVQINGKTRAVIKISVEATKEEATKEQIENTIEHLNRALEQVQCKRRLDREIMRKDGAELSEENFDKILKSGYVAENYRKMELDEKKGFDSLYFMELKISADELKTQVAKMMQDPECGGIFRVKGFVKDDAGSWMQLNATGHEISMKPIGDGQEVVIVIGEQLKEDCIRKYLEN